ncbi:MAG: GxxExxY protein [Candidatus Margulisbacteria bacterium]|nr:GxxExxY protein [Candidatus Margulisiibacteriota bacterium]
MTEIIHKELSYKIIGILYDVYNSLGAGYQEKYYQKAIKIVFDKEKIPYLEQVRADLDVRGINIGRYYIDFVVNHKIVLELKATTNFSKRDIQQVLGYLRKSGLELGILASFAPGGLKFKRILKGRTESNNTPSAFAINSKNSETNSRPFPFENISDYDKR